MSTPELPDWVLVSLRSIGLMNPDPDDELHVELVNAVIDLGPAAAQGNVLTAMRWRINWAQKDAGMVFAKAKVDYEHQIASVTTKAIAEGAAKGERVSVAFAGKLAEVEAYEAKLRYLIAEKREQSLRKMLDTIETQVDVWRTGRADERAADRGHAQGYSGGA